MKEGDEGGRGKGKEGKKRMGGVSDGWMNWSAAQQHTFFKFLENLAKNTISGV